MHMISPDAPIRLARPTADLATIERFWIRGVGLEVLWRTDEPGPGEHALTMVGVPGAGWHLELVADADLARETAPSDEDLLVVYLGEQAGPEWLARIEGAGGQRVPSRNPYWDTWGITVRDPDGYLLVLSSRSWSTD